MFLTQIIIILRLRKSLLALHYLKNSKDLCKVQMTFVACWSLCLSPSERMANVYVYIQSIHSRLLLTQYISIINIGASVIYFEPECTCKGFNINARMISDNYDDTHTAWIILGEPIMFTNLITAQSVDI